MEGEGKERGGSRREGEVERERGGDSWSVIGAYSLSSCNNLSLAVPFAHKWKHIPMFLRLHLEPYLSCIHTQSLPSNSISIHLYLIFTQALIIVILCNVQCDTRVSNMHVPTVRTCTIESPNIRFLFHNQSKM